MKIVRVADCDKKQSTSKKVVNVQPCGKCHFFERTRIIDKRTQTSSGTACLCPF